MTLHGLEQAQYVPDPSQGHALFAGEVLDHLHLAYVALRVAAPVGRGAKRLDEPGVLIKHQGPRVRLEDLGGDTDRVQRLVKVAERRLGATPSSAYVVRHGPPILV